MSSRMFGPTVRALSSGSLALRTTRNFQTSARRLQDAAAAPPLPARKPIGAFRGGLFGFLLGSSLAGSGVYYYVLQEYKASNDQLMEDIYALQQATQRMSNYLTTLEQKIDAVERKTK